MYLTASAADINNASACRNLYGNKETEENSAVNIYEFIHSIGRFI